MLIPLFVGASLAADSWTTVATGVTYLERTTSGPNQIHAAFVDLSQPHVWLQMSQEGDRESTTSAFASRTGAAIAVNGDWFSYSDYYPVGLAMGRGWQWSGQEDSVDWSFFACTIYNSCWINPQNTYEPVGPRFWNVVGGNSVPLVVNGAAIHNADDFYCCEAEPRTAVGIDATQTQLQIVVVDGRSSSSVGETYNEMADLMAELGAYQAMMLDGGGSSTMVVNGTVRSDPSDGYERTVSNPWGVMVDAASDTACSGHENTKYCADETNIVACEGGNSSTGDCAFYGASCEDDGEFAWCVDYRCPTSDGNSSVCTGESTIVGCTDGAYGEGDCAYYGAACVEGYGTAWCAYTYYRGEYAGGTLGIGSDVQIEVGTTLTGTVQVTNTGLTTWEPGIVYLAPTPRDLGSDLVDASWTSDTRVATLAVAVPAGSTGEFTVTIDGPAVRDYTQTFSLVAEGITWFGDYPGGGGPSDEAMSITVHVVAQGTLTDNSQVPGDDTSLLGSGPCGCETGGGRTATGAFLIALLSERCAGLVNRRRERRFRRCVTLPAGIERARP